MSVKETAKERSPRRPCHHDLSAVRQVEIADPVAPQQFPYFHQIVTLL